MNFEKLKFWKVDISEPVTTLLDEMKYPDRWLPVSHRGNCALYHIPSDVTISVQGERWLTVDERCLFRKKSYRLYEKLLNKIREDEKAKAREEFKKKLKGCQIG